MNKTKKEKQEKEIKKEETREIEELETGSSADSGGEENKEVNKEENGKNEINVLRDQLLRKAAEFENYKRRTESEISTLFKYQNEGLITDLLPVLDDFDRVLKSDDNQDLVTFKKGVELIYDKFNKVLERQGLKEIDSKGKPFDVNLHDALMQAENEKASPNTVMETVEKGYYLKDKVIRHAKVIVSKKEDK
jgi:molecular chaperone GrpE